MRMLPFFKPKKGFMIAGGGLDTAGGGGGGGSSVDYSTTPVRTGEKWLDGKDVYKYIVTVPKSSFNGTEVSLPMNADTLIDMSGSVKTGTSAKSINMYDNDSYNIKTVYYFGSTDTIAITVKGFVTSNDDVAYITITCTPKGE